VGQLELERVTLAPIGLVIFDCDGVLIDSEPLSKALVTEEAASLGWRMSGDELHAITGLAWSALKPLFEARLGIVLPPDWAATMQKWMIARLQSGVAAMPGACALLMEAEALCLPYRIASNSSHEEMAQKFAATGLLPLVQGRVHSARDVPRGKPAPDVFLAAAAAQGVEPAACLVIEDSVPGITAAHAAGMRVIALAPDHFVAEAHHVPPHLMVRSLAELPPIFRAAMAECTR